MPCDALLSSAPPAKSNIENEHYKKKKIARGKTTNTMVGKLRDERCKDFVSEILCVFMCVCVCVVQPQPYPHHPPLYIESNR